MYFKFYAVALLVAGTLTLYLGLQASHVQEYHSVVDDVETVLTPNDGGYRKKYDWYLWVDNRYNCTQRKSYDVPVGTSVTVYRYPGDPEIACRDANDLLIAAISFGVIAFIVFLAMLAKQNAKSWHKCC